MARQNSSCFGVTAGFVGCSDMAVTGATEFRPPVRLGEPKAVGTYRLRPAIPAHREAQAQQRPESALESDPGFRSASISNRAIPRCRPASAASPWQVNRAEEVWH